MARRKGWIVECRRVHERGTVIPLPKLADIHQVWKLGDRSAAATQEHRRFSSAADLGFDGSCPILHASDLQPMFGLRLVMSCH